MRIFAATLALLLIGLTLRISAQSERVAAVCTEAAFAALRPLPTLDYECPGEGTDSDETILKLPGRRAEIGYFIKLLTREFAQVSWWQSEISELNACQIHGRPGALTADEKERRRNGEYTQ